MTFDVSAESDVRRDWNETMDWDEARGDGVGLRFDDGRRRCQTRADRPEGFRVVT